MSLHKYYLGSLEVKDISPSSYLAIMCGFSPVVVLDLMIRSEMEANARFGEYTALDIAAMQGRVDVVRLLLERGAQVHR